MIIITIIILYKYIFLHPFKGSHYVDVSWGDKDNGTAKDLKGRGRSNRLFLALPALNRTILINTHMSMSICTCAVCLLSISTSSGSPCHPNLFFHHPHPPF